MLSGAMMDLIRNPHRLRALSELQLLDTPPEEAYDRMTRLASRITGAPISLVNLIDGNRQFFKSAVGLTEPLATIRQTPLSHSICKHLIGTDTPLVIEDATRHPLINDHPTLLEFNVHSYLGVPLKTSAGVSLGSFCVMDYQARSWGSHEVEIMRDLAQSVMTEIELRNALVNRQKMDKALLEAYLEIDAKNRKLKRIASFARTTIHYTVDALRRGASDNVILIYLRQAEKALKTEVDKKPGNQETGL